MATFELEWICPDNNCVHTILAINLRCCVWNISAPPPWNPEWWCKKACPRSFFFFCSTHQTD